MIDKLAKLNMTDSWDYFSQLCQAPEKTQKYVLNDILKNSAESNFAKKFGISEKTGVSEFISKVPVSSWSDYIDHSAGMQNGAADILFNGKPVAFLATSGTSGLKKLIPESENNLRAKMVTEKLRRYHLFKDNADVLRGKFFPLANKAESGRTQGGVIFGSASGLTMINTPGELLELSGYPMEALAITNQNVQDYVIMRFAIAEDVRLIIGNNIARMVKLVETAKENAAQICDDIEYGRISYSEKIDKKILDKLLHAITPNPERAAQLRQILKSGNDFIPAFYWKNLKLISCWLSGSVGNWVDSAKPLFPHDVTYFDYGYGASEGKFNIPREPENPAGVLALHSAFYEFIPYGNSAGTLDEKKNTLMAHQLEKGKLYEMVITTYSGLYRYNLHDIIKVTGFYKNTPEIVFVSKTGDVGDLVGERLAGSVVLRVVTKVFNESNIAVKHICAVTKMSPPHYVICVEPEDVNDIVNADKIILAGRIDSEFRKEVGYNLMRRDNLLFPVKLQFMKPGWQQALYNEKTLKGRSIAQVKIPVIYNENIPFEEFAFTED